MHSTPKSSIFEGGRLFRDFFQIHSILRIGKEMGKGSAFI